MSYLTVHNPEKVDVKTGFKGQYYDIPAGEKKSFPEDLANWFLETYPFLSIVPETKSPILEKETKPEVEEKVKKVVKK
jgi:hypothetical protein